LPSSIHPGTLSIKMNPTEQRRADKMIPDIGQHAPDFTLPDSAGMPRNLGSLVAAGPLVLLFFRGHW